MSNRRALVWLTILLALAIAGNVMVSLRQHQVMRPLTTLGSLLDIDDINELCITNGGALVARLTREVDWKLVEPFVASVDRQTVTKMLDALTTASIEDSISDAELLRLNRKRAAFKLDPPQTTISVAGSGKRATIGLGTTTASTNSIYAAVEGSELVLSIPAKTLPSIGISTDQYRSRELLPMGANVVIAFDVKRSAGALTSFVRTGDAWVADGKAVSGEKIDEFLNAITTAKVANFIWPTGATNESAQASVSLLSTYGLDSESASAVTFRYPDGATGRIAFGRAAGDKRVYALVQNGGAIVTVDSALRDFAMQDAMRFSESKLFPIAAADVTSFSIVHEGVSYVVARGNADSWRLEAPIVASADAKTTGNLLGRILALTQTDATDSDAFKVSVNTNFAVRTVAANSVLGKDKLENLRSREIADIDPTLVKRLVATSGSAKSEQKPTAIVRDRANKSWNVESTTIEGETNVKAIDKLLGALHPLRAERVVCLKASTTDIARFGLEKPFFTLSIDQEKEGAIRRNLIIGAEANGGRFATVGSADAVFVLPAATVRTITSSLIDN